MGKAKAGAIVAIVSLGLAGCVMGPRFEPRVAQVRDAPVLANLSAQESLAKARVFLSARQYGLAIELFKAAKQDPALSADALNGLAIAYDGIGRRDLAERYFQEALAARPGDERTQRNLAAFYQSTGQGEKRRILLAEGTRATPEPARDGAEVASAATEAEAEAPLVRLGSPQPVFAASSPLEGALRPLRVRAGLGVPQPAFPASAARSPAVIAPAAMRDEVSVICSAAPQASANAAAGAPMAMFRISVGEVFIAARPPGSSCRVDEPVAAAQASSMVSNTEYLGLVAAYLDQLNKSVAPGEIAALWRAAFWADGRA